MTKASVGTTILFVFILALAETVSAADIRVSDRAMVEGNAGRRSVDILVVLSTPATVPVEVSYTTQNGSAAAGSDYVAANGKVSFSKGEFSKKVSINVIGDTAVEANETFDLVLSNATGATIADGTGRVTIVNDDGNQRLPTYEVRLTYIGSTGHFEGTAGCLVRNNGSVVLEGLISGNEKVAADDDIEYEGTLWLSVDIDQCEADRKPNSDKDFICGMTVIGDALVKTSLAVYADERGGYVQFSSIPGAALVQIFGMPISPCTQSLINDEIPLFPDESIAAGFNGTELKVASGPLRVGRYVNGRVTFEVLRKIS